MNVINKRVVVGLAVTPTRINLIEKTLISLINQTHKPDAIYINLPNYCIKENSTYKIPDFIDKYNYIVKIIRFDYDFGPSNKLIPILKKETDPETLIFTADDDIVYDINFIKDYINILRNQDIIISSNVWTIKQFLVKMKVQKKHNVNRLLELDDSILDINVAATGAGAVFKVKYFDNFDFFKYVPKHYYYGNDLFFSLITNHIKKIKSEKIYYRHLDYGNKDDALSKSGQNIKNYINIIKDWFKVDYVDINIIKKNIETCPFFKKYTHQYHNGEYIYLDTYYTDILKNPYDNLMIVAHPDDEIIFGGNDLISENNWLVIVCTNDFSRQNMIKSVSKNLNFDYILINHIDTQIKNLRFHPEVLNILFNIIKSNLWNKIVTHNSKGEYGHPQHILVHKMVCNLVFNLNYNNLYTFNDNNKVLLDHNIITTKSDNLLIYNRPLKRWPQIKYYISKKTNTTNYNLSEIICK